MKKITIAELPDEKSETTSAHSAPARQPVIAGAMKEIEPINSSEKFHLLSHEAKLTELHPRILAESLNLHGVRELNSPLAG